MKPIVAVIIIYVDAILVIKIAHLKQFVLSAINFNKIITATFHFNNNSSNINARHVYLI